MTCTRCERAAAVGRFCAVLRRATGRGHVRSNPEAFCDPCSVTVAALLAPGRLERVP